MKNPTFNLPPAKYVTGHLHRFADLNSLHKNPHSFLEDQSTHSESIEAKWEQMQDYEAKENNPSLSSLASSSTTSSASTSASSSNQKLKSKLAKLKANSFKKLNEFKLWVKQGNEGSMQQPPPTASEVNHAPSGITVTTKLRAAKSMQNLEQLTRDSLYNLKDISSNLKQKYNSRMELRQQSQMYNELWDDEDGYDFYNEASNNSRYHASQ